jgi:DNA mismatch repair protein MutL
MAEITYPPMQPRSVPLSGRSGPPTSFRVLGQYKATLLLLEGPDGLYLIDQHVAHERILYERFRANIESDQPERQTLLEPELIELSPAEVLVLEDMVEGLEACGFEIVRLGGDHVGLAAIPASMEMDQAQATLQSLLHGNAAQGISPQDLRRTLLEEAAASMACRAAVKMHDPLAPEAMESLLSELFEAEQPFACPHGRPIILRLSDTDLEVRFKRR